MSKIAVGDLVQVVKTCCNREYLGTVWVVGRIFDNETKCKFCGQENHGIHVAKRPTASGVPIGWLKRIPPLSELEGERTEENLKEPA